MPGNTTTITDDDNGVQDNENGNEASGIVFVRDGVVFGLELGSVRCPPVTTITKGGTSEDTGDLTEEVVRLVLVENDGKKVRKTHGTTMNVHTPVSSPPTPRTVKDFNGVLKSFHFPISFYRLT